jgi:transcriptional regulator with XRE-family HTH domain
MAGLEAEVSDLIADARSTPSLGLLLRAHRNRLALTIDELAAASGVSARTISDLELGQTRRPRRRTLAALVTALSMDVGGHSVPTAGLGAGATAGAGLPPVRGTGSMPRSITDFVGRATELAWLAGIADSAPAARAALISGPPGVGKTALAVQGVAALADPFPDGPQFVDMRGLHAGPLRAEQAAARLLRSFGVADQLVPIGAAARIAAYQAILADRNTLIVFDNVADEEQIRPLLPLEGGSRAVLTSRRRLSGLAEVSRRMLAALPTPEALALLELMLAGSRPAEARAGLEELARLCGNLPLALRGAGNRLLSRPGWTVAHLVARVKREGQRLDALSAGDLQVSATFALSYRQLSPAARRTLRQLSTLPRAELGLNLVATLEQRAAGSARPALAELVELGLLSQLPGGRYELHDLLRDFARTR